MSRIEAIEQACALMGAGGRAERLAWEFSGRDFSRMAERNLIYLLLLYAWATRNRPDLVAEFRERARWGCREYRKLRVMA